VYRIVLVFARVGTARLRTCGEIRWRGGYSLLGTWRWGKRKKLVRGLRESERRDGSPHPGPLPADWEREEDMSLVE
jgi:hypothetical protein